MKVLLLDFGSSFVKYSFYDVKAMENSEIISLKFPEPTVDDGVRYEVSREKIEGVLLSVMAEAEANMCEAVFISTQMHGYFVESKGEFSNYISWRDKRGEILLNNFKKEEWLGCGTSLKANLPFVSLHTFGELRECRFFTLGSYLSHALTGKNVTHITDGCASGFFSADTCDVKNKIDGLELPFVTQEIILCGRYKNMDVYTPIGDHQASFLGCDALSGDTILNLGTAAQLAAVIKVNEMEDERFEYRPYFSKKERLMTLTGMKSANSDEIIDRVIENIKSFGNINRVLISGGSQNCKDVSDALAGLGYKTEIIEKNTGNEGLKRIANSIFHKCGTMLCEVEFVNFPFVIKKAGLDFFIIDNEHGSFENKVISVMALNSKSVGIEAIVRLPNNERSMITKLADGGVSSFLLPMTNTKEDIERVIEYSRYTPDGKRGVSTTRAHTQYGVSDLKEYLSLANKNMKIYAQIESRKGVENIDDIVDVEGLDGVFIGPNDLSCDYECIGDKEKIKKQISVICRASLKRGKPCGIITTDKELIKHAFLCGCSCVSYGSELNMMLNGAKEIKNEKYL